MHNSLEMNPITYEFLVEVVVQSIEKDGEEYLRKLMQHFSSYNFEILNGRYERKTQTHDRLGNCNPHLWDVIEVRVNLKRKVSDIHSPSDYINNKLHQEIYDIFASFRKDVVPNDDKLDYVTWINERWRKFEIKSEEEKEFFMYYKIYLVRPMHNLIGNKKYVIETNELILKTRDGQKFYLAKENEINANFEVLTHTYWIPFSNIAVIEEIEKKGSPI